MNVGDNERRAERESQARPTVGDIVSALDEAFPLHTQDTWDNSGLLVGDATARVEGILLTVDHSEAAIGEALRRGCNMVVSHHPLMFRGLKRLTGATAEQRIVMSAISNGIALAAFHTPADKSPEGTSGSLGRRLGLRDTRTMVHDEMRYNKLFKVATFVPLADAGRVREAMSEAGAGRLGDYSHCTWETEGDGRFMAQAGANPYVGEVGELHIEKEVRIEAIARGEDLEKVVGAIRKAHPYEEPAIDTLPMEDTGRESGYGVVGDLEETMSEEQFLDLLKRATGCQSIRHNGDGSRKVRRVAICTGSGSEFVGAAVRSGADAYVTADMKYHQMADAAEDILVADIGHFESEEITIEIFRTVLTKKIPTFARYFSFGINPIKYY